MLCKRSTNWTSPVWGAGAVRACAHACAFVFTGLCFDPKERPRSAVEQLCLAESARPRMTVEEQMERIRRHQQACLRERKKGLSVISASDQSPLQSPSAVRDNPFRPTQVWRNCFWLLCINSFCSFVKKAGLFSWLQVKQPAWQYQKHTHHFPLFLG